jgi:transcription elongation factor GreA
VVIDESELDSGRVGMNSKVTIKDLEFGDEETYTIVGSQEANPAAGKISDDSPIGRVVIGKVAGDILNVEAPGGTFQYQLISVE